MPKEKLIRLVLGRQRNRVQNGYCSGMLSSLDYSEVLFIVPSVTYTKLFPYTLAKNC